MTRRPYRVELSVLGDTLHSLRMISSTVVAGTMPGNSTISEELYSKD